MLDGKVAVITGGASGIGRAIARRYAADGARIVIGDMQTGAGQAVAEELDGHFVHADLRRRQDCYLLIEETVERFGTIHILVNNAGFQHIDSIEQFPEAIWNEMIAVMLTAPFLLTRYAWPHLKAQQWGRIINLASIHATVASPFKSGYVTAKHALLGLTKTIALEGAQDSILAYAICPAYVRTPLVEKQIADQASARGIRAEEVVEQVMLKRAAVKRLIEPEEVAEMATFLCGPGASTMTGASIMMDLGWTVGV
jgi:3-hydroxybutyrate dehydrogenase